MTRLQPIGTENQLKKGNSNGQNGLGLMYYSAFWVGKSLTNAFRLFSNSAEQGDATGELNLGFMYQNGISNTRNDSIAATFYSLSANQGSAEGENGFREYVFIGVRVSNQDLWLEIARTQDRDTELTRQFVKL